MTDRELLELAAKAADIELWHEDVFTKGLTQKISQSGILCWNPLTNDGDALRLAVKLRLTPHIDGNLTDCEDCTVAHLDDPYAATRRAITRAAAEIGKAAP
jgi:Zn-finger protein